MVEFEFKFKKSGIQNLLMTIVVGNIPLSQALTFQEYSFYYYLRSSVEKKVLTSSKPLNETKGVVHLSTLYTIDGPDI